MSSVCLRRTTKAQANKNFKKGTPEECPYYECNAQECQRLQVMSKKHQRLQPSPLSKEVQCDQTRFQLSTCSAVRTRRREQPAIIHALALKQFMQINRFAIFLFQCKGDEELLTWGTTFQGNPTKESHGAKAGGKTCLQSGPTRLSSTVTSPLVSRKGKSYLYLEKE